MEKSAIYVNDSIFSFDKYTPTVIDVNVPLRVLGLKIESQLKKILDFFYIDNKEYALIMGDNDVLRLRSQNLTKNSSNGNNTNTNGKEENEKNLQENILDDGTVGGTEILDYSDEETMITNLLIINSIMGRFKNIYFWKISFAIYTVFAT